ncbi:MAG: hypothetical protein ACKOUT_05270 [Novosphingobium sp.]
MIDPTELFNRVQSLWPQIIGTDEDTLNDVYWPKEDELESDDWLGLGAWAFHQALWMEAKAARDQGLGAIPTASVTFSKFDSQVRENLRNESWEPVRHLYGEAN